MLDALDAGRLGHHFCDFPAVQAARELAFRDAIANANVPNMVGRISTRLAHAR